MILLCNLTYSLSVSLNLLDHFVSSVQFMVVSHLAHCIQMNGCYEREAGMINL